MLSHKKGIARSYLVGIIVVILSFGMMLISFESIANTTGKALEGANCHTSLGFQKAGDTVFAGLDNNCKTLVVDIPEKRSTSRVPDIIYEALAKKIASTWWITHEGTIKNMWEQGQWAVFVGDSECFVVYELNIRELPRDSKISYEDLYGYLLVEEYQKIDGISYRYLDYIQTYRGNGAFIMPEVMEDGDNPAGAISEKTIEGQQVYALSVISKEKTAWNRFFENKQTPNVMMFSTLEYAEDTYNCRRRGNTFDNQKKSRTIV